MTTSESIAEQLPPNEAPVTVSSDEELQAWLDASEPEPTVYVRPPPFHVTKFNFQRTLYARAIGPER